MPRQSEQSCCQRRYQPLTMFKSGGGGGEQTMAHVEEFKLLQIRQHESAPCLPSLS